MVASELEALGVERKTAQTIIRGIAEGQYQLMCGAGVSLGAPGGDGVELQLAKKTSQDIAKVCKFNFEQDELDNLSFVYEEAKANEERTLREFLLRRFTGCKPTWQIKILQIYWRRIWTLNIDDVLEVAFEDIKNRFQYGKLSSISWREPLRPVAVSDKELQIVHLHGIAERLKNYKDDVVFSPLEYSEVTQALPPWHAAFQSSYVQDPFIICGAKFSEEPDFIVATRMSNQSMTSAGIPSLIVTPGFSVAQAAKLQRFGLIPVSATGEAFFDAVHADLNKYRKNNEEKIKKYPPGVIERFVGQFRELLHTDVAFRVEGDFYSGDQPSWSDVQADRDVELSKTFHAAQLMVARKNFVGLLYGAFATGKSTGILRLAKAALSLGLRPYLFRNENAIDVTSALSFMDLTPEVVLLFDDAADHSAAIGRLVQSCAERGLPCRIYATERISRMRGLRLDVEDKFRVEFPYRTLTPLDMRKIVRTRRLAGRLGKYAQRKNVDIEHLMKESWRAELVECLSQIEFGEGFRSRVARYVASELNAGANRELIAAIACTHRFGHALPLTLALSRAGGFESLKISLAKDSDSESLIIRDSHGVRLRHRIISEYVWESVLTSEERYASVVMVAKNLAPLINPSTIISKSKPHRIVRELLDQEALVRDVGIRAPIIFDDLEYAYGWSSRFWDQRALLEYELEHYDKAYSFSHNAVSLEKHAFAFTTLGTICLKESIRLAMIEKTKAKELFFEGTDSLDSARRASERLGMSFEHPFVAFFSLTARFVTMLPPEDIEFTAINELWGVWTRNAKDAACFQNEVGRKRLADLKSMWMKAQLARERAQADSGQEVEMAVKSKNRNRRRKHRSPDDRSSG
ncbi:SIR2 family protein [Variovorax paradoxus]|uniref:P-loop NTPase n=1 Tax=Variovorax paradoxus TaxID=34073 RepID=UPI0009BB81C3|nr:SIR2 family protein [Variovorax paradoxus]